MGPGDPEERVTWAYLARQGVNIIAKLTGFGLDISEKNRSGFFRYFDLCVQTKPGSG